MSISETVVIAVYVMVDEFQRTALPPVRKHGGFQPALHRSEVLTLALLSQVDCFASEAAFWRMANAEWRHLFPRLPHRTQLNRAIRAQTANLVAFGRWCARHLDALTAAYEVLDCTAVPLRANTRRGVGALPEVVGRGKSLRLGWYVGVRLLIAVTPMGVITGWTIARGETQDRALADDLLAQRAVPEQTLASAGRAASGLYLADTGFAGRQARHRWATWGAEVIAPPQPDSHERWSPAMRRQHQRRRQIVETVFGRLHRVFRLDGEHPTSLRGLQARIAAKIALSNAAIQLNHLTGRPALRVIGLFR
jgi:hypothetical protein